jgi:hypothetical protein
MPRSALATYPERPLPHDHPQHDLLKATYPWPRSPSVYINRLKLPRKGFDTRLFWLALQRYATSSGGEKHILDTGTIQNDGRAKRFLCDSRATAFRHW